MPDRVLVVDDDEACRTTVAEILSEFHVGQAQDVSHAMDALATAQWDAVVSDMDLPDGKGTHVLEAAPGLARILLTGHSGWADVKRVQEAGQVVVLFKPVDPEQLLTWVRHGLAMTRLSRTMARSKGPRE